jgi:hypothetical protein
MKFHIVISVAVFLSIALCLQAQQQPRDPVPPSDRLEYGQLIRSNAGLHAIHFIGPMGRMSEVEIVGPAPDPDPKDLNERQIAALNRLAADGWSVRDEWRVDRMVHVLLLSRPAKGP